LIKSQLLYQIELRGQRSFRSLIKPLGTPRILRGNSQ